MANAVYREFAQDDLSSATVQAWPSVVVESGSGGWTGNTNRGDNSLSLYGGVRSRSDVGPESQNLQVYPLDDCDTHSIDKVIGVPGEYPMTASINIALCTNEDLSAIRQFDSFASATNTRWYDEHWAPVNLLCGWYHDHVYTFYPELDSLPSTCTVVHVPEMFYGRAIATGTVRIWHHAWDSYAGANHDYFPGGNSEIPDGGGTRFYVDDGIGRLFDVPEEYVEDWRNAWQNGLAVQVGNVFYNEGLIVFTSPNPQWHEEFVSQSFNQVQDNDPSIHIAFSGSTLIKSMVFTCRLAPGDANASNNPTWSFQDSDGKLWTRSPNGTTYVTSIGLYNEERQLVAVAKIAQPIRKRAQDNLDIRLRLDV